MSRLDPNSIPLHQPQLIEASAGTGKTYTITNLCLRLLLGRDLPWGQPLPINKILILTFTIAATAELKSRIARRIHQARQAFRTGEGDDYLLELVQTSDDRMRDLKLLTAAGQLMDEASIFTIHGFCARVLAEQAFEAGSMFNSELNAESDQLLRIACEDCFRRLVLPGEPAVRSLTLNMWRTPNDMAREFSRLLFRGPLSFYPATNNHIKAADVVQAVHDIKQRWIADDIETLLRSSKLHKRRKPYLRLEQMRAYCEQPAMELESELWEIYSAETLAGAMTGGNAPPTHPVFDAISELPDLLQQLKANLWHEARQYLIDSISQMKADANLLTLDDLLIRLSDAVNQPDGALAEALAERWPVAMIDEFQDTDIIQSSIFSPVYTAPVNISSGNTSSAKTSSAKTGPNDGEKANDRCLLMIGDPKQAIYGFRGADIYTYINARRSTEAPHSLAINWRSSPAMISATNHLFDQPDIFGNDSDMPFVPVSAPEDHADMSMSLQGHQPPPYQVFVDDTTADFIRNADAIERLMAHAAEQTVQLLNGTRDAQLDGRPVNAGQIAFLVRRRADADAAQRALTARGVKSVYLTLESVFLQPIADDLKLILEAIIEPTRDQAVRSALATRLMQTPASEIDHLNTDIRMQQQVTEEFKTYHQLWLEKDVAHMLGSLMKSRELDRKWLAQPDGERQLTNLRHLTEILQQQSIITPGMHQLVKWFGHEQRDAETVSTEERQLRLESDENLVKIVTMHAAKGLEYDIVMIPMPVFLSPPDRPPYLFHEETGGSYQSAVELFDTPEHVRQYTAEQRAEEMRLLYVSLTRARYRCYLGLPKIAKFPRAGIAQLVRAGDVGKEDSLLDAVRTSLPADLFEIVTADDRHCTALKNQANKQQALAPLPAHPAIEDSWRLHSYTSVAARLHTTDLQVTGFTDDDDQSGAVLAQVPALTRHTFPRGARTGIALHSLMEDIDFTQPSHTALCERTLRRIGLEPEWLPVLEDWLTDVLHAPLHAPLHTPDASSSDFKLADIMMSDRLDEMEFHFTLDAAQDLAGFLREANVVPESTSHLQLKGQMTGLIDLLFRRDGRYFIADYKSNHLGQNESSYQRPSLEAAMHQHQYHLQYLIYTIAVHRMLKQRLHDYDYEQHFGGVYYLFLRGLNQEDQQGIYFTRPTLDQIEQLDRLLDSPDDRA